MRSAGREHCGEFACQSGQRQRFDVDDANRANRKINNLRGLSRLGTSESLFLRHCFHEKVQVLAIASKGLVWMAGIFFGLIVLGSETPGESPPLHRMAYSVMHS